MKRLSVLFTLVMTLSLIFSAVDCGPQESRDPVVSIVFTQMDFNFDGTTYNNTEWGGVDLTFIGQGDIMYLNLAVNGSWQVQNIPVLSGRGVGVEQTMHYHFDLGVERGTDVTSLNYAYAFTSNILGTMPGGSTPASVGDGYVELWGGEQGGLMPDLGPARPLVGGEANSSKHAHANFPNQECEKNECAPAAISNSLRFLNTKHNLGMKDNEISIGEMKKATGWANGAPPNWWELKKDYMEHNKYPITTTKITDMSKLADQIDAGQDVEIRETWKDKNGKTCGHVTCLVGIARLKNGKYSLDVVDDRKQGKAGGCDKPRSYTYDPATGNFEEEGFISKFEWAVVECPAKTDITPPTTTKVYGQPYYTDGVGKWITADTPISLAATDDDSGVDYTKYRVWYNGAWTDWLTYTGPFTMGEIDKGKDCLHKIEYYSVDKAGNEESWQEVAVEADAGELEAYSALAVDPFALRTTHAVYTEEGSQNLIYEMSTDFGETWTGKTALASGLAEASEPDIQIAPNGNIHIVFVGYLPGQQKRISHIWYNFPANSYSYDNATNPANWEARVLVDDTGRDNVHPEIAIDSLNNVHCVWIGDAGGSQGGAQDVFYSRFDGSSWSPRLTLYPNATTEPGWPNPQIIADCYDSLHVVFLDSNEHKMKYLTYYVPLEFTPKDGGEAEPEEPEWGSYHGGVWSRGVADNIGGSSASYGTVAGLAIEGTTLHITWQDVRGGDGEVYENTRDLTTTDAFGTEWQITTGQYIDDGTSVGETIMGSDTSGKLHLFYCDSVDYDIWYMEYSAEWSKPVKVANSGSENMHLWPEMAVDNFDSPLLTYTKAPNDETEFDICYKKPYHNQIVRVDNTPPTTTKVVNGTTVTLEAKDNCHCEKWAILVSGPDGNVTIAAENDINEMEEMLKQKCKETGGWQIIKLTADATDPSKNATKENIEKAFKTVGDRGKKCCQLFFYYSGHGSGYHKDDGYKGGRINMNCNSEPGETYNEKDFKITMTQERWDALAPGQGYLYDTDGDGVDDMFFGKDGILWKGHPGPGGFVLEKDIGADTNGDHDIDKDDIYRGAGGADLNGNHKADTFCIDEDLSVAGPKIYDDQFAQYIKWVCNCTNVAIVLDSCFSGGFIDDIVRDNPNKAMEILTASPQTDCSYTDGARWSHYNHFLTAELKKSLSLEKAHENAIKKIQELRKTEPWVPVPPPAHDSDPTKDKFLYCCGVGSYQIHYKIWRGGQLEFDRAGDLNQPVSLELAKPGEYIIEYWAVDDLGNEEEHHSQPHTIGRSVGGSLEAGKFHTAGLKSDGTVVATGGNSDGQLQVTGWSSITQVAAGCYQTVGVKSDGTVVAVGYNEFGQCNVGGWTNIVQVAASSHHTVGVRSDGSVVAVGAGAEAGGYPHYGQCNVTSWSDIVQVATGAAHTVGLKSDGTVVAVGAGAEVGEWPHYGQCNVSGWSDIVQVAAGGLYTVGLKSDGTVVAVGANVCGQCDVGGWSDIVQVAAGWCHTVGLKADGTVVAVGDNYYGQLNVGDWTDIREVAAGYAHTVGLKADGSVVAVGDNGAGQCNVGDWMLG